ncbi:sensor histidine kinase [Candidatus Galacturonibacter soehngenii]|uniref:histidine kinase n=1 Tax=Candidatus Galacturonatibacter soehngenii TaxID=2307010 RepID=A0A7V7QKA6_9FIRM|nr:HAMP domain-containing sensor histidine kinase [Candidatus Galacturonibacter soehngenii]KAB1438137.1 HAMP domain-containing histidine kinase [Candidatus Galacturonibacter soehngenii]
MFNTLRKQLTLLYTITTGIILTVVIGTIFISFQREAAANNLETFQNNLYAIETKLQTDSLIKYVWLAEYENNNNLLIHIEDNGKPIDYEGYGYQSGLRNDLVELVKERAMEDGINSSMPPITSNKVMSDIYKIKWNNKNYLGAVDLIKEKKGYRSVILLQYFPMEFSRIRSRMVIFIMYGLGVVALYVVSWKFVGKSLKPVEENRKRQTEFIAAASHELKAPLAVLQTSASALKYGDNQAIFIKNIENECVRMSNLIEDMLLLASTDAKNWSLHQCIIDADTLVLETYERMEALCREQGYRLVVDLPTKPLPKMEGDKERLTQVLSILINNSLAYANAKERKEIRLRAYEKRNYIYIQVIDYGIGIKEEIKANIFERFYRGDEARNEKSHFGLGLSIAKEIIELHGGIIKCEDTEENGSTFTIKLKRFI